MNAHSTFMDRVTEEDAFKAAETLFACMFADGGVIDDCGLEPEDFGWEIHQKVFKHAEEYRRNNQPVTPVSLKPHLPKVFRLKDENDRKIDVEITPSEYLSKLMIRGADPYLRNGVDGAIHIIKSVALGRSFQQEMEVGLEIAKEGHSILTIGDEIEHLEQRLKDLRSRFVETTAISSPGTSYLSAFQASSRRDGVVGVPIALPEIAKVLSEPVFEAGNLYGLLSSSGEGKTSLTVQLILHALKEGHPVLLLSYDESSVQIIRRMIAMEHGIEMRQQRDPMRMMTERERDTCVAFASWVDKQLFEVIRCQREGIEQLMAYARRFVKKARKAGNPRTPLIVLDHVGKVKPRDPKLSADRISGDITVEAKACADETGSAWLALNQRNGLGEKRDNPRPIAADLYGGTGARADYDAVLYLYSAEKYKAERVKVAASDSDWKKINKVFGSDIEGIRELGAIKVRFGDPTITEMVKFEPRYARYVSMAPKRPAELDL